MAKNDEEPTFASMIAKERERLAKLKEDVHARQRALEEELTGIDRELEAIAAYEAAKQGKPIAQKRTRTSGATGSRAPKGQRQNAIKDVLSKHPDGLKPIDILTKLGATAEPEAGAYRQALMNMKKKKEVGYKSGLYLPA